MLPSTNRPISFWTPAWRLVIFALCATSIWCLLAEFYGLCSMRVFTFTILIPAIIAITALAIYDRVKGDGQLFRAVIIGSAAGLAAAIAYDLFRLPFVIAAIDHLGPQWLRLPLFKVFPRFGAMIVGEHFTPSQTDSEFSLTAHVVGWIYHFSNGMTFGIMYLAMIGHATRRSWLWAIVLAVGLELAMLKTPYTRFFDIAPTLKFFIATMAAHLIFGIVLGWLARQSERRWKIPGKALAPSFPG